MSYIISNGLKKEMIKVPGHKSWGKGNWIFFLAIFFTSIPLLLPWCTFHSWLVWRKARHGDCKFITITATCHLLAAEPPKHVYLISVWKNQPHCFTTNYASITEQWLQRPLIKAGERRQLTFMLFCFYTLHLSMLLQYPGGELLRIKWD